MFILVQAHPVSPGQGPESHKMVVVVVLFCPNHLNLPLPSLVV